MEKENSAAKSEAQPEAEILSEALWQADTMAHAGCQLVNCGFRKLVVKHESRMKRLQAERDALSHKVTELIKEKQENVLVTVLARRAAKTYCH